MMWIKTPHLANACPTAKLDRNPEEIVATMLDRTKMVVWRLLGHLQPPMFMIREENHGLRKSPIGRALSLLVLAWREAAWMNSRVVKRKIRVEHRGEKEFAVGVRMFSGVYHDIVDVCVYIFNVLTTSGLGTR
jgi:hypothetical protein